MKLINKHNFISIVCISFTLIVIGKLSLEYAMDFFDRNYTLNIFACLFFSVIITAVLALHYYLQRFPLIPVIIGQYIAVIAVTVVSVLITDRMVGTETKAMFDMIRSVTIPYAAGAAIYYFLFFRQVRKANRIIAELNAASPDDE